MGFIHDTMVPMMDENPPEPGIEFEVIASHPLPTIWEATLLHFEGQDPETDLPVIEM